MPVDPGHIFTDVAHEKTIDTGKPYACHNREPIKPFMAKFQKGWTKDGRRIMVKRRVEFKTDVNCGHIGLDALNKDNDPKCKGCRWQGESSEHKRAV